MTMQSIIAANSVQNGGTVYLTSCDAWTPELALAEIVEQEDHDWRLAFANRLREVSGAVLRSVSTDELGMPATFTS